MDFRPTVLVTGTLLAILAIMMCVPAIVDYLAGHKDWEVFALSAGVTFFVGGGMALTSRTKGIKLSVRQAFFMTTTAWVFLAVACGMCAQANLSKLQDFTSQGPLGCNK